MKFQRINEDTVRCIVYKKDMQEFGIRLEDFFRNKSKVHEFLHEIVERAGEEVGYTPKEGMLSMQIIPINPNTISITFTETSEDYPQMLDNLKDSIEAGLTDEMLLENEADELDELDEIDSGEEIPVEDYNNFNSSQAFDMTKSPIILIAMNSIEKMADFCRTLDINKTVKSELYYLENKDMYCMIIEKNRLSENDMRQFLILAIEYTSNVTDETKIISHVREYGENVIEKSAYRILKNYV